MEPRPHYDLSTAVTFFLAGLGAGSLLALIFSPRVRFFSWALARPAIQGKPQSPAL